MEQLNGVVNGAVNGVANGVANGVVNGESDITPLGLYLWKRQKMAF